MPKEKKVKTFEELEAERRREQAKMEAERLMPVRDGENKNMRKRRRRQAKKIRKQIIHQENNPLNFKTTGLYVDPTNTGKGKGVSKYSGEEQEAVFRGEVTKKVSKKMIKSGLVDPMTKRELDLDRDKIIKQHTHYFRGDEAKKNDVSVKDGKLVDVNGKLLDTRGAYMDGRFGGNEGLNSYIYALGKHGQLRSMDPKPRMRSMESEMPGWMWRMQEPEKPTRVEHVEKPKPESEPKSASEPGGEEKQEEESSQASDTESSSSVATSPSEKARRARKEGRESDDERARDRLDKAKDVELSSVESRTSYYSNSYSESSYYSDSRIGSDGERHSGQHHERVEHHGTHHVQESSHTSSSYSDSQGVYHPREHKHAKDDRRVLSEGSRERRFTEKMRRHLMEKNQDRFMYGVLNSEESTGKEDIKNRWSFGWMNHSSLFAGDEVAGAGELHAEDGELLGINNSSGHHRPGEEQVWQTLNHLSGQGLSMEKTLLSMKQTNEYDTVTNSIKNVGALRMLGYGVNNRGVGFMDHVKEENAKKEKNIDNVIRHGLGGNRQNIDTIEAGVSHESGLVNDLSGDKKTSRSGSNLLNTKSGMLRHVDPSQINDRSAPNLKLPGEQTDLDKPQPPKTEVEAPPQPQTIAPSVAPRGKSELIMQRIAELSGQKPESKPGTSTGKKDEDVSNLKIAELKERLKKAGLKI